ncbi:MAG: noncanonical pyrimidine nucleotidase, YjjG family [Oscillospiraceae bacterium]|nr:noncanonical pyrimidine nucleotidase, YjjG family [Oscillospiraceae bacterium]
MIKTVLFDLDDTLLDFHKAEAIALRKTLIALEVEPSEATIARYSEINAAQWRLLEEGKLTREQVLTRRFSILFDELGVERSSAQAKKIYEHLLGIGHYFIPGAPEVLAALAPKYDLYLVSNGTATVQESRLESAGIEPYFKNIFISQAIGFDKPQKEFFDRCFAQIPNFVREEAIIVGDSLTSDMRGGCNAGIRTCWFNPHRKPRCAEIPVDYEIAALVELPALLEQIQ